MKIAVLITCYNRKPKTLNALKSIYDAYKISTGVSIEIYITDDNSTDGTSDAVLKAFADKLKINILKGSGSLYWNGGMINSWKAAIAKGGFTGYLWLNDDTIVLKNYFIDLIETNKYSKEVYKEEGIYIGSTYSEESNKFTYGGFNFTNKITLSDKFIIPNGTIQTCHCAHGNITYVSDSVVKKMGIFTDRYIHSGGDHDYTYRAYKKNIPLLVMKSYVGICENDHICDGYSDFFKMNLKNRLKYLYSPLGFNLHNTLLFQKRCFPYRYPFVMIMGYLKAFFPITYFKIYRFLRE